MFRNSSLSTAIDENILNIPSVLPYVIVADDVFPLDDAFRQNLVKPYPLRNLSLESRITNYRISCARRISENAFGIMANRFHVFLSPLQLSPKNVEKVTLASCVIHNFLRDKAPAKYTPPFSFDREDLESGEIHLGYWRCSSELENLNISGRNTYTKTAKEVRDGFSEYFNSPEGSVPWQEKFI